VIAQAVPAHIGSGPGGDPYGEFLPPPLAPSEEEDDEHRFRAVVFVTEETRKGTVRAGQEYEDPLLVLRGDEYQTLSFAHLHQQLCDALRGDRPRLDLIFLSPEGDLRLFFADGSTQEVPRDDEP
jgi:hypothetical protein